MTGEPPTTMSHRLRGLLRRTPAFACWGYLALVAALWFVLGKADSWWPATILMFAPRWVFALPLVFLFPVAIYRRSIPLALVLAGSTPIALGGVAGFNVPWAKLTGPRPSGMPFRVVTLNMHYSKRHVPEVDGLIQSTWPDVVAIQEWVGARDSRLKTDPAWHFHATENLYLASRHPIRRVAELGNRSSDWLAPAAHYELDTPGGVVHLFSIHAASSRDGISDTLRDYRKGSEGVALNSAQRRDQLGFIASRTRNCSGPVIVLGDFNTPPESFLIADKWPDYTDAFDVAGWGFGYTFVGARTTVRIDHVLVNRGWGVADCWVGPRVGSPHRPVIADLVRLEQ
jgi:endonuclease/exonuclease/phosphatase (EEP) superfamily protein YafD